MRPEVRERRSWSRQKRPMPPGMAGTTLRKVPRSFCHRDAEVRRRERGKVPKSGQFEHKVDGIQQPTEDLFAGGPVCVAAA
eukprot:6588091-Ditylum_brightwellii.AAC.1